MIGITNAGGGGNKNQFYQTYNGLTAPNNAIQGDIWVKTERTITYVSITSEQMHIPFWSSDDGYVFIVAGPAWVDDKYASFDRRKKHFMTLYPLRCYMAIDKKWVSMDAFIRNYKGKWFQFSSTYNGELFANGNQYTEHTGGWVSTANCQNGWYVDGSEKWIWPHAPALEISTVMKIWQTSNPWVGTVFTGKAVDVTNYSKLYVDLQYNCIGAGLNNGFNICVTKSNGNNFTPLAEYNVDTGNGNKSYDGTISIDLSSISGPVYVAIASHQHGGTDTGNNVVTIRRIWRE